MILYIHRAASSFLAPAIRLQKAATKACMGEVKV